LFAHDPSPAMIGWLGLLSLLAARVCCAEAGERKGVVHWRKRKYLVELVAGRGLWSLAPLARLGWSNNVRQIPPSTWHIWSGKASMFNFTRCFSLLFTYKGSLTKGDGFYLTTKTSLVSTSLMGDQGSLQRGPVSTSINGRKPSCFDQLRGAKVKGVFKIRRVIWTNEHETECD
jgi:hypothetical protein